MTSELLMCVSSPRRQQGGAGAGPEKTTMPSHLKEHVRARMEKTGESYEQALRHVRAREDRTPEPVGTELPYARSPERTRSVADTAFATAMVRAEEADRPQAERLFEDPYARLFAAAGQHVAEATQRFVDLPFFRDGVRLRTRFIDDFVRESLTTGLTQMVILGVGFDARGLRMPEISERRVAVFEVDTPAQLERKRTVLKNAGVKLPVGVAYVPFDFDGPEFASNLTDALQGKGFRRGEGAVFVWEGVVGYIDDAAIDQSLRFMASAGGERSRLVFTFGQVGFETDTATDRTRRAGFRSCQEIAGDDLWRRYLPGEPHPNAWVTRIGTAVV
jgi:methyltransferase (TIGR00027 family)